MTKAKISEYDASAGNNTDVNNVNIAEGCAPSGINNAIREVMAALKRFETGADGDSVTVGGNLVVSGSATLGDASGDSVTINASTVSTPNGLNFDSNTFVIDAANNRVGIGTSSPSVNLEIGSGAGTSSLKMNSGTTDYFQIDSTGTVANLIAGNSSTGSGEMAFYTSSSGTESERMRIDSSGNVGIGTSSPFSRIHTYGTGNTGGAIFQVDTTTTSVSGNTAIGAFPHCLSLYNADNSQNNNIASIGFSVSTTGATSNAAIAAYSTAAGAAALTFHTETGNTIAERMRIDSSGNVGIGTSSPAQKLSLYTGSATSTYMRVQNTVNDSYFGVGSSGNVLVESNGAYPLLFLTSATERMRIDSSGRLLVGTTTERGQLTVERSSNDVLAVNRTSNDGTLVGLYQDGTQEGNISVSGTTVSYNGGHLSRWAQITGPKDETLVKGTVLSNLDEMNVYIAPTTYWTEEDELPVDEEGNPTVAVGDVKVETHEVQNEQLNKVKVSDVEGDANVAGVFVNWSYDEAHSVDEINMAMTGDMIIRIAQGVAVQRGDLLMSAGDGTAKPQEDDIVRSKTIAKVTSTNVTCTYKDGSYCVPCVLMAC